MTDDEKIWALLEEQRQEGDEDLLHTLRRIIDERLRGLVPPLAEATGHDWELLSDGRTGRCRCCGIADRVKAIDGKLRSLADGLRPCIPAEPGAKPLRLKAELDGRRAEEVLMVVPHWAKPPPNLVVCGAQLESGQRWCEDVGETIRRQHLVRFILARLVSLSVLQHGGGYSEVDDA